MMNRIRVLRAEREMTQEMLAVRAGVSRVTVNRVERGISIPNGMTIMRLAAALGCPAKQVFPSFDDYEEDGRDI